MIHADRSRTKFELIEIACSIADPSSSKAGSHAFCRQSRQGCCQLLQSSDAGVNRNGSNSRSECFIRSGRDSVTMAPHIASLRQKRAGLHFFSMDTACHATALEVMQSSKADSKAEGNAQTHRRHIYFCKKTRDGKGAERIHAITGRFLEESQIHRCTHL